MAGVAWGCNAILGYEAGEEGAGARAGAGAVGGVGGSGGEGAQAGGGAVGGSGGEGGGRGGAGGGPSCGNGIIDGVEQCDDANDTPGDGCDGCVVQCDGQGEVLNIDTLHCYWVVLNPEPWHAARFTCQSWGGDLSSITTSAEDGFVTALLSDQVWIGGHDGTTEGTFEWVSQEPWSYENWDTTQPDTGATGEIEDCVEIHPSTAGWHDDQCNKATDFVCERPPPEAGAS